MMLSRTDLGSQYRSYSNDAGETWTPAEPTNIKSPLSPASIKRIPTTGDLLLIWNDHSTIPDNLKGKRTPLSASISRDEGLTWSPSKPIESNPDGWYCYTAITFAGENILLAYCAGQSRVAGLNTTHITTLPIAWLYDK
jgi:hypothetical protein